MKLSKTIALVAVFGVLAAACGDDDDDDAADTGTGAPAGTAAAVETSAAAGTDAPAGTGGEAAPSGGDFASVLLPKCTGNPVFDQANEGAQEAAAELGVGDPEFVGPATCTDSTGQIEFVTNATTQGVDAIMISNNAGDQLDPAVQAAADAGITVVTWDSPIPSGAGESLFVAQVDFDETGQVMADMAVNILGDEGGEIAILSATPEAANQNAWIAAFEEVLGQPEYASIELVDTVYGNDDSDESYNQALALIDEHPDLELIMAPTTVGIAAAAKAMQDEGLCETVKVSGLGLPSEMQSYTENGCAPEFALWSFVDLGYLAFQATHGIATGTIEPEEGATFTAGRMGDYTIEKDPTREDGLRIVMGPFSVYDESNVAQGMNRVAFRLHVRPELIDEYRAHHVAVWPEMREALRRCGWHNYSLFLDGDGALFGYFETPDTLAAAVAAMQAEPVNTRWQALMAPYFVAGDAPADQQMDALEEVFHLP